MGASLDARIAMMLSSQLRERDFPKEAEIAVDTQSERERGREERAVETHFELSHSLLRRLLCLSHFPS